MKYLHNIFLLLKKIDKNKKELYFLYGYSLPTTSDLEYKESSKTKINNKYTLFSLIHTTNELFDFTSIINIDDILKNDNNLSDYSLNIPIESKKNIIKVHENINKNIQASIFAYTPTYADIYYTNEIQRLNADHNLMDKIINTLKENSSLPFDKQYKNNLGSFEILSIPFWIENNKEICEIKRNYNNESKVTDYIFSTLNAIGKEKQFKIHLIIYNNYKELIYDKIHDILEDTDDVLLTTINDNIDSFYEYWIFDNEILITRVFGNIIKEAYFTTNVIEKNLFINTNNFKNKSIPKGIIESTEIYTNVSNSVISNSNNVSKSVSPRLKESKGGLFNKDDNGFEKLKFFFNDVTYGGKCSLIIVDPFISSASLEYLIFLENSQVDITFVSAWSNNTSPDGIPNTILEQSKKETIIALNNFNKKNIPLGNSKWYNLKDGLFHDRYIIVEHNNHKRIFTLSNSLNNLLSNHPNLLIYLIENIDIYNAIDEYINNLKSRCIPENLIYPDIN